MASKKLQQLIIQRDTIKGDSSGWLQTINEKKEEAKKQEELLAARNRTLYEFGVLNDFFNYSAMSIQAAGYNVNLALKASQSEDALYTLK